MPSFRLKISGSSETEISIDVGDTQEAVNAALNALSQFACRRFPPPGNAAITVMDSTRKPVATLKFVFSIDYPRGAGV